jgi:AcrR family transcriptional regulator
MNDNRACGRNGRENVMPRKRPGLLEPSLESQRRRQLIQAVVACVSEEGFEKTSMRKIAERAGVSTGMLTYYFRDKRDLVNAAMVNTFENSANRIDEKTDSTFGPRRLDVLLEQWFTSRDPGLPSRSFILRVRAAALTEPELSDQLEASAANSRKKLERSIRAGIEHSEYPADLDPALAADLIYGLMIGWTTIVPVPDEVNPDRGLEVARLALALLQNEAGPRQAGEGARKPQLLAGVEGESTLVQIERALASDQLLPHDRAMELQEVFKALYVLVAGSPGPARSETDR